MEAMIARCLDSAPEKRPSARELVEFMVQLPQQISLNGTGVEGGSTELTSSEAQTHRMPVKPHPCVALITHCLQLRWTWGAQEG